MAITTTASDIHLRSSQSLGLQSQTPFSVTVWINATWTPGTRRSFVGIYGPATDTPLATPVTAMQIGTTSGNGELSFWTWGGGILTGTAAGFMNAFNSSWVFIAYTYDGTTHRGYLNGTLAASANTAQIAGFLNQIYINGYPGGVTSEVATYQCDSYALYNRRLLDAEIQTIYHATGARHGIGNGMLAKYEFDELSAGVACTSVPDLTGNGNTLTVVGGGTAIQYIYSDTLSNSNIRPVV